MMRQKTASLLFGRFIILVAFIGLFALSNDVFASGAISRVQRQKTKTIPQRIDPPSRPFHQQPPSIVKSSSQEKNMRYKKDAVDFDTLWKELKTSSESWPLIVEPSPKEIILSRYIALYKRQGVLIRKTPLFYMQVIDHMAEENPQLFRSPFKDVLKFVAIVEYDFDNGQDKDTLARSVLGESLFRENKKRLGL